MPAAPGTVGAAWGLILAWLLFGVPWYLQVATIILLWSIGVPICGAAARRLGGKDPACVIYDEAVTVPIVFLFFPPSVDLSAGLLLLGFLLHRLFDIWKPWPISRLEWLRGGLGIMADDAAAAAIGLLIMQTVLRLNLIGASAG